MPGVKHSKYKARNTKIHGSDIFLTRILALQLREQGDGFILAVSTCYIVAMAFKLTMLLTFACTYPDARMIRSLPLFTLRTKKTTKSKEIVILFILCYLLVGTIIQFHNFIQIILCCQLFAAYILQMNFDEHWRQSNTITVHSHCRMGYGERAYWLQTNPLYFHHFALIVNIPCRHTNQFN